MGKKKLTIDNLIKMIPEWCKEGALVSVERGDKEEVGIIVEICLIEPAEMEITEVQQMIEHDEWLLVYVCTQIDVSDYYLDEVTPIIKEN